MNNFHIIVAGSGINGLSAALAMAKLGHRVALLDPFDIQPAKTPMGRVYALNAASMGLFEELGVTIPPEDAPAYQHMKIWVANRDIKLEFDADLSGSTELGWMVGHETLHHALLKAVQASPHIECFPNSPLWRLEETADLIHYRMDADHALYSQRLDFRQSISAQLLMIADSAQSPLLKALQVPVTQWSYHQDALITLVETEDPHQQTAYQVFLPTGPLAFLPLADPHHCAIVWSSTEASQLQAMDDAEFNQALTQAFESRLGHCKRLGPCTRFPLQMRHVQQYSGARWLVLGDAAHTLHPLAGQGLNMGLADLNCWLRYFSTDGFKRLGRALKAYQRERKTQVWQMVLLLESLHQLNTNPTSALACLRDAGFQLCNDLTSLKRFLIEQARG